MGAIVSCNAVSDVADSNLQTQPKLRASAGLGKLEPISLNQTERKTASLKQPKMVQVQTTQQKLEILREKLKSYKALYDAGKPLPQGTDDDFCPGYVKENSKYKVQMVDWMVEYNVPELYIKTLESTTYTTWLGEESIRVTPYTALDNVYWLIDDSKALAQRLLASGFLDYAVKNLNDQRYLENYKDNEVVRNVMVSITDILAKCVELIPDHPAYKQVELTQVLKKYISSDFKYEAVEILLAVASKEECTALVNTELEILREKLKSYKALYDAGKPLPQGTDDDFFPGYVKENSKYKVQMVDWMVEYNVPELYIKTLESSTYTTWLGEASTRVTPYTALNNVYWLIDDSKVLAQRLLASGFLDYAVKNLKDQRYLENYKDNEVVRNVMLYIIHILKKCFELIPDHAAYKQLELTQVLKRYISSDFKDATLTILLAIASEEECTALVNAELKEIRAKMESYKQLYDAGDSLPGGSDYLLCPFHLCKNTVYQDKVVPWMQEYKVLELFKRTLDQMTSAAIRCDESVYTTCYWMLHALSGISFFSKIFAERMLEINSMQHFVKILNDPQFAKNQDEKRTKEVLDLVLGIISNCVARIPSHVIYKTSKLTEALKPYLTSDNMKLRAKAMIAYSRMLGEDESKQLDGSGIIPFMITGISAALHRADRCYPVENTYFPITGLLGCVTRIAANDDNKTKLVAAGLLPLLVNSLQTGPEEELEISARLTWALCFKEDTKKKVEKEPGLVKELERLSKSKNNNIKKEAQGAIWKISGEVTHQHQAKQQTHENKHIFISYQWDNQDMTKDLNMRLKKDGYKTWIDVEQMGGSTLGAMAGAVENAAVVLICASEKYKDSPNCRTEGEYTYTQRKPVVPLMMQSGYKADGWLGALMGARLYIRFDGKYEFEEAYQMLMKEIKPIHEAAMKPDMDPADVAAKVPQPTSVVPSASPVSQLTSQSVVLIDPSFATWNKEQVMEWAKKHNLTKRNSEFDAMLEGMDGKQLKKFCGTEKKAPDTFYKMMREDFKFDMVAIISLQTAMEDLE